MCSSRVGLTSLLKQWIKEPRPDRDCPSQDLNHVCSTYSLCTSGACEVRHISKGTITGDGIKSLPDLRHCHLHCSHLETPQTLTQQSNQKPNNHHLSMKSFSPHMKCGLSMTSHRRFFDKLKCKQMSDSEARIKCTKQKEQKSVARVANLV